MTSRTDLSLVIPPEASSLSAISFPFATVNTESAIQYNTIQYELDSIQPAEKEKDTRGRRNGKFRGEETQRKEKQHIEV